MVYTLLQSYAQDNVLVIKYFSTTTNFWRTDVRAFSDLLSVTPTDQEGRPLEVIFYFRCCITGSVGFLARKIRLTMAVVGISWIPMVSTGVDGSRCYGVNLLLHRPARTPSFPTRLVKTKSDFIVRSVETGLGKWMLVVAVISVDAYLFLAFSDLTYHLEDTGIGVFWLHYATW